MVAHGGTWRGAVLCADEDVMGLPCISSSDQVIAVLAPAGTTLEVPDPVAPSGGGPRQYRHAGTAAHPARPLPCTCTLAIGTHAHV
jgi:hypothetical protein